MKEEIFCSFNVMELDRPATKPKLFSPNMTASRHPLKQQSRPELIGVVAGSDIPADRFISLDVTELVLGHDLLDDERIHQKTSSFKECCVKVYWRNERLETNGRESSPDSWLHLLRSARDRHEQNLELVRWEESLFLYTLRRIDKGEELLIWYREGLAREVGVPILTPCHIRGYQKYVCSGCQTDYAYPNTLKAHMFLQCMKSLVSSTTDEDSLVPFHHLLQSLGRTSSSSPEIPQDNKTTYKSKYSKSFFASSPEKCHSGPQWNLYKEEAAHKSAFKAFASVRNITKETSEECLMMPDSSTDQSSVLNLSVKVSESEDSIEKSSKRTFHDIQQWNAINAQRMMAQTLSIPFDYSRSTSCFPASPHLHAFGIQFMGRRPSDLSHAQRSDASCEGSSLCCTAEYSLLSPHLDVQHERLGFSLFKSHATSAPSSVRQARPSNPYSFTLPSDKEPLDLLPQAYFANKSKKGHLCLCCGKLYSRKYGLKIHMRTHNGYKPLKCKICSRPFGDPSNLNKHVRLHAQGETPYRCDFCGKVLVRRRDLERHVRSRHPMECIQNDDAIGMCESSRDSSPVSVESSENSLAPKETCYENS